MKRLRRLSDIILNAETVLQLHHWNRGVEFVGNGPTNACLAQPRKWHSIPRLNLYDAGMSSRTLGGGRILGSGKGLSPSAAAYPPGRSTNLLSPTASSISVTSSISTSQPSTDAQDLSSRVSLDQSDDNAAAAVAGGAPSLVCPICNEEMVCPSLLSPIIQKAHAA